MRTISALALTALGAVVCLAPAAMAETLVVPLDHTVRIGVQGQAASVVIGNAAVADVTVIDTHTLFVSGKSVGQTDVSVLDGAGRTIFASDVDVTTYGPGRVAVFRGQERTDFNCAPGCAPQGQKDAGAAGAAAGAAGGAPVPGK